jgi:hypothetical protein
MTEESTFTNIKKICFRCGSDKTRVRKWQNKKPDGTITSSGSSIEWYKDKNGTNLCQKCYCKYVNNPRWYAKNKTRHRMMNNGRHMRFKNKPITLEMNPRIGICNWCRAVTPFDCGFTVLHHEKYDDSNPLAHTIEICQSCHSRFHLLGHKHKHESIADSHQWHRHYRC